MPREKLYAYLSAINHRIYLKNNCRCYTYQRSNTINRLELLRKLFLYKQISDLYFVIHRLVGGTASSYIRKLGSIESTMSILEF